MLVMTTFCTALHTPPFETVTEYVPGVDTVIDGFEPNPLAQVYDVPPEAVSVSDVVVQLNCVRLFVVVTLAVGWAVTTMV